MTEGLTWLSPGDKSPNTSNFFDMVQIIRRFRVLLLDVQVQMSTKRGACESLVAERACDRRSLVTLVIE